MNRRTLWIVALGLGLVGPTLSFSQDRGNRGGGFDLARMQEERLNNTKADLGATDEEWQVLKPKIEKVWTAQMAAAGGLRGMFSSMRGGRDRGGDRPEGDRPATERPERGNDTRTRGPVEQASRDLRDVLENKEAPADQVAAKLAALREAKAKAKAELETARKDLQAVLTPRQEAVLVAAQTLE